MKKYKNLIDVILIAGLTIISLLAITPKTIVMPTGLQMIILAVVLGLLSVFLVFMWRERPDDEREAYNQAAASRAAYTIGALVLIVALVVQSLHHNLDSAVPLALMAMIITKLVVQRTKDAN